MYPTTFSRQNHLKSSFTSENLYTKKIIITDLKRFALYYNTMDLTGTKHIKSSHGQYEYLKKDLLLISSYHFV